MSKEMKSLMLELKRKYSRIDDRFLNLFEKRNIVFIENGIDLKSQFDGSDEEEEEPVELTKETQLAIKSHDAGAQTIHS